MGPGVFGIIYIKSMASKLVDPHEQGRIFSLLGTFQTFAVRFWCKFWTWKSLCRSFEPKHVPVYLWKYTESNNIDNALFQLHCPWLGFIHQLGFVSVSYKFISHLKCFFFHFRWASEYYVQEWYLYVLIESIQSTYVLTFAQTPGLFFFAQPNPQLVTPYKTGRPSTLQMSGPPESP